MRPQNQVEPTWAPKKEKACETRISPTGAGFPAMNLASFFIVAKTHPKTADGLYAAEKRRITGASKPTAFSKI